MTRCSRERDVLLAASSGFQPALAPGESLEALRASAVAAYQKAIEQYYFIMLKYYTEDDVAKAVYRKGDRRYDKETIQTADPKLYAEFHTAANALFRTNKRTREYRDDIEEYETYIRRASQRLSELKQ
jgi:hypothetical protein